MINKSCGIIGISLVRAIHVGVVQGSVAHAVHWLRTISSAEHNGRLADDGKYAKWRHLLCHVRRPRHYPHSIVRHVEETIQGKGQLRSAFQFVTNSLLK